MTEPRKFQHFGIAALILMLIGWGGVYYIVTQTLPYFLPRWLLFILLFLALTGTALPVVYFLHKRFPDEVPVENNVIVRQAMWVGVFGATLAWLQLGHLLTAYLVLGLAGALIAIEYFIRMREKSLWKPSPASDE